MTKRYDVKGFTLTIRCVPDLILSNAMLPDFRYGGGFVKRAFHPFRPSSVVEWIAYLYERPDYELLSRPAKKRQLGQGDIFLQNIETKVFKDVEVKGPTDGLHMSQVVSLATNPSSELRQREVVWFETEKENDGEIDMVPCPRNDEHMGRKHTCMDGIHRPDSSELSSPALVRDRGPLTKLHTQDCNGMPILTVKVPKSSLLVSIYEDFDALLPRCCYRLFGSWDDSDKGAVKLQIDRDSMKT